MKSAIHTVLHSACPPARGSAKKSYIDDQTWQLGADKLYWKKRFKDAHRHSSFDLVARIFKQWAGPFNNDNHHSFQQHSYTVDCGKLLLTCKYWTCAKQLKQTLQSLKGSSCQKAIDSSGPHPPAGTLVHVLPSCASFMCFNPMGSTSPKKTEGSLPSYRSKSQCYSMCRNPRSPGQMD